MRPSQRIKTGFLFWMFLGSVTFVSAQKTFKYEASINKVDSTGFYRITLDPGIVVKSKDDLSDIRLLDQKGDFVPYINSALGPRTDALKFHPFPQVKDKALDDTGTTFIVKVDKKQIISFLYVRLKNTEVKRSINISGSDDLKHWYAIQENSPLGRAFLNDDGTYMQELSFPGVNYLYLKLLVNDKNKVPIKFLQAGIYVPLPIKDTYFPVSHAAITKKDSNKTTYLTVNLTDFYRVDLLQFNISGPKYYKRKVIIYAFKNKVRQLIGYDEINSNNKNYLSVTFKKDKLELQIINGDNPPLNIKDITTLQKDLSIISYLEKGKSYKLLTGDNKAKKPEYDLNFFLDSIHSCLPVIEHGKVIRNPDYAINTTVLKKDYSALLWLSIIIALVVLSFLTWKMIKEVNGKTANN